MTAPSQAEFQAAVQLSTFLAVTVPGEPVSKGRARYARGRAYTPGPTTEAEERFGWAFRQAGVVRNERDELGVRLVFRAATRQRRDIDNCVKLALDAANGIVWGDDQQVVRLEAEMHRGVDNPGTTMEVWVVRDMTRFCEACGTALVKQQERFCSKDCYDTKQRRGNYRRCVGCGKDVYRQADKSQAAETFCSPECRTARRGKCRQCGTQVKAPPSQRGAFCTAECATTWYRSRALKTRAYGSCACGAPISRRAKQCRACFYASRST